MHPINEVIEQTVFQQAQIQYNTGINLPHNEQSVVWCH